MKIYNNKHTMRICCEVNHDEKWIAALMRSYYSDMFNYGNHFCRNEELVKDSIQEVFIDLWRKRDSAGEILNPKFYLMRAVKNKVLKALGRTSQIKHRQLMYVENDFISDVSVEKLIVSREILAENHKRLQFIIGGLSKREKEAIYLKYYQQFDNSQIAELLNINRQSVYNLLSNIILKLRACWHKEFVH